MFKPSLNPFFYRNYANDSSSNQLELHEQTPFPFQTLKFTGDLNLDSDEQNLEMEDWDWLEATTTMDEQSPTIIKKHNEIENENIELCEIQVFRYIFKKYT